MKWDYTKNPPQGWYVEDGDWVPVDPKLIKQCQGCGKWFVEDVIRISDYCSPGCKLKRLEKIK
jgi:reverse gyrase